MLFPAGTPAPGKWRPPTLKHLPKLLYFVITETTPPPTRAQCFGCSLLSGLQRAIIAANEVASAEVVGGVSILALNADERVKAVRSDDDTLSVDLMDGRAIPVPLAWYPRLLKATQQQRDHWEAAGGGYGIHWPDIDENLSTEGLLRGARAPKRQFNEPKSQRICLSLCLPGDSLTVR